MPAREPRSSKDPRRPETAQAIASVEKLWLLRDFASHGADRYRRAKPWYNKNVYVVWHGDFQAALLFHSSFLSGNWCNKSTYGKVQPLGHLGPRSWLICVVNVPDTDVCVVSYNYTNLGVIARVEANNTSMQGHIHFQVLRPKATPRVRSRPDCTQSISRLRSHLNAEIPPAAHDSAHPPESRFPSQPSTPLSPPTHAVPKCTSGPSSKVHCTRRSSSTSFRFRSASSTLLIGRTAT